MGRGATSRQESGDGWLGRVEMVRRERPFGCGEVQAVEVRELLSRLEELAVSSCARLLQLV